MLHASHVCRVPLEFCYWRVAPQLDWSHECTIASVLMIFQHRSSETHTYTEGDVGAGENLFVRGKKQWTKSWLPVLHSPKKNAEWRHPATGIVFTAAASCTVNTSLCETRLLRWAIITLTSSLLLAAMQTVQLMRILPAFYEAFQSVSFLLKTAALRQLHKQVIQTVIQLTLPGWLLVFMIAVQCRSSMSENVPFSKTWKNIQRKEFDVSTLQPE